MHAASPNKIGRDAAELCGLTEPTGIVATDDVDALIALKPDCVVYTAQGETRPMEALEQMSKFLAAGINVAATSMVWLVTPRQADDWLREPLEKACQAGNASLYVNGIDPGYSGDTEVHSALSLVTRATSILVQEIFDYANYDDYEFTGKSMGFGMTADDGSADALPAGRPHHDVGRSGPQSRRPTRRGTRRGSAAHRAVVRRQADRMQDVHGRTRPDGRGPIRGRRGARRGSGDHHGTHHPAHRGRRRPTGSIRPTARRVSTAWWSRGTRASNSTRTSRTLLLDVTEAGCVSTAARVVNAIDWICRAPAGLIAVEDIPQAEVIRGLMW